MKKTETIYEFGAVKITAEIHRNFQHTIASITTRDSWLDEVPDVVLEWISTKQLYITNVTFFDRGGGFQVICQSLP